MGWCGFVSSFIGLELVVLYPCDLSLMGFKVWLERGDEIDTTYRKKQEILSTSGLQVAHGDINASYASQPASQPA